MMLRIFRRQSRVARAVEATGLERCSMARSDLWIGLPPSPDYGRTAVKTVPELPGSVLFAEGPEQAGLVAAPVASREVRGVERLMIGTTHDYIGRGLPRPYDFSAAIAALEGASLPALKWLSLGDMERLFNGHVYYGRLGDITHVFDIAPSLEELRICGHAEVHRPGAA